MRHSWVLPGDIHPLLSVVSLTGASAGWDHLWLSHLLKITNEIISWQVSTASFGPTWHQFFCGVLMDIKPSEALSCKARCVRESGWSGEVFFFYSSACLALALHLSKITLEPKETGQNQSCLISPLAPAVVYNNSMSLVIVSQHLPIPWGRSGDPSFLRAVCLPSKEAAKEALPRALPQAAHRWQSEHVHAGGS